MIITEIKVEQLKEAMEMERHRLQFIQRLNQYKNVQKELESLMPSLRAHATWLESRQHGSTREYFKQLDPELKKEIRRYSRC